MANLQPLRSYIRQNISHLRSTPCLLISSSPPPSICIAVAGTKSPSSVSDLSDEKQQQAHRDQLKFQQLQNDKRIHSFVERNTQSLTFEFNLRSVPCYISSAFPTLQNVNEAVSLAKRAGLKKGSGGGRNSGGLLHNSGGDGVVIGIGSGAAMDLAKAVADTLFDNIAPHGCENDGASPKHGGSLVLAPCTLGGLWAASSNSPSILLDTKEEMLLPHLTPSWSDPANIPPSRRGTVVTLDPTKYLAMPPLYTPFQPVKRSEYSAKPSMAHVAAASLAIVLDVARSLDVAMKEVGETTNNEYSVNLKQSITNEMKVVASSCASVLELAARESTNDDDDAISLRYHQVAEQYLLGAIPRLSTIVQQSTLLTEERTSTITTGTIPQKLANALLPQYFPQCHLVTYLACILPGLCDALSSSTRKGSFRKAISRGIKNNDHWSPSEKKIKSLSAWASHVTMEAGVPTMASLAFGTPDMSALVGSLDSYDTLMSSLTKDNNIMVSDGQDDQNFMEDVLRRSLHR